MLLKLTLGLAAIAAIPAPSRAAAPLELESSDGMVVTAQHTASEVGAEILRQGGNAIDAAVAVGYALAVTHPCCGNLGGGGFVTIHLADGRNTFLNFREKAPQAARADMFLDAHGNVVSDRSLMGYLAVGVPGTVMGLETAREKYGTMPRAALMAPSIRLAAEGFVLTRGDVDVLTDASKAFRSQPNVAAIFLKNGKPFAPGDRLLQLDLAATLRAISDGGTQAFYHGAIAAAVSAASQAHGGLLTREDFAAYTVTESAPVTCPYRGYTVVSAPPPSSGGITLCEMLQVLEGYPLGKMGFHSSAAVHVMTEAMRYAYRDRNTYLGDPAFVDNPVARLLSARNAKSIRAHILTNRATPSAALQGGSAANEHATTTHYSIVDRLGNVVAVTYTINDDFGAKVIAGNTGFFLNNEMDDFTAKPGFANYYGLVQGKANAIAPGKRPLSSMSPTIVSKDGKPVLVTGTPGGSRILTVVLHSILNVVDYGMNVQEAADAPRIHNQWMPDVTNVERFALSPDTRKILEGMGHHFAGPQPANHLAAILIGAPVLGGKAVGTNRFYGANDPRRNTGLALGY